MTVSVQDIGDSKNSSESNSPQTPSPRRHSKSPKKVRFDDRHQNSSRNILSQSTDIAYKLIHTLLLRPLKEIIGLVFVYLLGFMIAVAVVYYSFHVLKIFLLSNSLRLPNLPRGVSNIFTWTAAISHLPAAVICATTGKRCPQNQQLLNVTYSVKEEIRQASKVLNTLDLFEPSKSNLMTQSVHPPERLYSY
jgi:hypothetical protein